MSPHVDHHHIVTRTTATPRRVEAHHHHHVTCRMDDDDCHHLRCRVDDRLHHDLRCRVDNNNNLSLPSPSLHPRHTPNRALILSFAPLICHVSGLHLSPWQLNLPQNPQLVSEIQMDTPILSQYHSKCYLLS